MIVETSGWRHSKEKNKLFLSYEYQKKYHPSPKMSQLAKIDHKSKRENFISPLRFKKSNYVIRLFSKYCSRLAMQYLSNAREHPPALYMLRNVESHTSESGLITLLGR